MRGKRPKERKSYVLRMGDGTIVEVTREVYLEWYQSRRRERYQHEKIRNMVCPVWKVWKKTGYFRLTLRTAWRKPF